MALLTASLMAGAFSLLALQGQSSPPGWEQLAAERAVIAEVEIVVRDVFDLSRRPENNWFGRLVNAAHVETRAHVVERELLFAAGDVVDVERLRETERNLRRRPFIRDARVVPVVRPDRTLVARVEVDDAWSLDADLDFSRTGGNLEWSARIDEGNLFGTGKRLFLSHEEDLERRANELGYIDPQLFGSRWTLSAAYGDLSDGSSRVFQVERPYFSIETRYAVGGFVTTSDRTQTHYNRGDAVSVRTVERTSAAAFASRAYRVRSRTAERLGVVYRADELTFGAPRVLRPGALPLPDGAPLRVRTLAATWSLVQDRSVALQNLARIGRTEDYNVGWVLWVQGGFAARGLGSDETAPVGDVAVSKGWSSPGRLLFVNAGAGGRRQAGAWRNAGTRAAMTVYQRAGAGQTIAARISAVTSTRQDTGDWLYLGGRDGLRGYVDHFLAGDRRATITIEDRVITSWRPLGLFQAGFSAYVDAGLVRRADTGRWSRVYANVGGGLRFGVLKSGTGSLILISAATPLVREPGMDRVLLVLGNSVGF